MRGMRSFRGVLVVAAVCGAGSVAWPTSGWALPSLPSASAYVTNGPVDAVAVDGSGRVYLAGVFTQVGPRIGHGLSLSASDDQPAAGWPDVNGTIYAVVSDGAGGWFIGGQFTDVGGLARSDLAHVESDGTVDPSWDPDVASDGSQAAVLSLALSGGELFVGGGFTSVDGVARDSIAEVSTAGSGTVDPTWDPDASCANLPKCVDALLVSGSELFVGGGFSSIGGQTRPWLAEVSTAGSGQADPTWDPDPNGGVFALALSGSDLFVGGQFSSIGGQSRNFLAEVSATGTGSADPTWNPGAT